MSTSIPSWEDLKARKVVQWALAYLAGAFAALELLDILAAAQWLRHATRLGAREARSLRANPVFARVRGDPGFEAAVVEQDRLVARERREAMPLLDRGPGSND